MSYTRVLDGFRAFLYDLAQHLLYKMVRSASGLEFNAHQLMHIVCTDETFYLKGEAK